jgi:hypothetical protein
LGFFGLKAALAFCFSHTLLAQDIPGQKLGKLRFYDSPYEIVVVTNDDTLWESRVKGIHASNCTPRTPLTLRGHLDLPG